MSLANWKSLQVSSLVSRAPPEGTLPMEQSAHLSVSPNRQGGFTLIEVLAAFAILSLALTILTGAVSRIAIGERRSRLQRELVQLAQLKLDMLGTLEPISSGRSTGRFDNGYLWQLEVSKVPGTADASIAGYWTEVTVSALNKEHHSEAALHLVTFKLVQAPRR